MKHCLKTLIIIFVFSYFISSIGCATPPKKDDISQKDILIQNLSEENAALRQEIERLTKENEVLMQEKLQIEEKSKAIK